MEKAIDHIINSFFIYWKINYPFNVIANDCMIYIDLEDGNVEMNIMNFIQSQNK